MAKQKPVVVVTNRKRLSDRLKNPFGAPSTDIHLNTDIPCVARWFNEDVANDRIWRAKNGGWEPVTPDMLVDKDEVGGFQISAEGHVCRGEKQRERLMFMPTDDRNAIQRAKTDANIKAMKLGRQRDEVAQAAAERFGDRAGDFIGKTKLVGTVTDQYERIHRDDQVEE